jgi:hypothetical protein
MRRRPSSTDPAPRRRVHVAERQPGGGEDIASLEIRWPTGIVQTLKKVRADQILTVTELVR